MEAENKIPIQSSLHDWADSVVASGDVAAMQQLARQRRMYANRPDLLCAVGLSLCESAISNGVGQRLARACWHVAANRGHAPACLAMWAQSLRTNRPHAFGRAWPILLRAARLGSIVAMRNILHFQSNGKWRTTPNMLRYLEVLTEQRDALASRCLAQAWDQGWLGLPRDDAMAFQYFLSAAESGDGWSQYCVGTQYAQGCGVTQNDELAVLWYRKGAHQGVAAAQLNLGYSYEIGRAPLSRSMSDANFWYRVAAMNGMPEGKFNLAQSYRHGKGVPENYALANEWYLSASQDGHPAATYCIARAYELGIGVAVDWTEALRFFARAMQLGNAEARAAYERLAWQVDGATEIVLRSECARHISQDICAVIPAEHGKLLLLADGAGGCGYGRETADAVQAACQERLALGVPDNFDWAEWLECVDRQLARTGPGGLCTVVLLWLKEGVVSGASVGDSQAWLVRVSDVFPLTALQAPGPLLGSGAASVTALGPCVLEGRLVVASDGLWHYVSACQIEAIVRRDSAGNAADALIAAARLPSGNLGDDVSLIVITPQAKYLTDFDPVICSAHRNKLRSFNVEVQ